MFLDDKKDADPNTDRGLLGKLLDTAIVFAISAFLIYLGVEYIISVRVPLLIIGAIAITIYIIFRAARRRHHDDY